MNCKICYDLFDINIKIPITLIPCSHCFCTVCISRLPEQICPNCRRPITDKNPNYSIIDFLEEDTQASTTVSSLSLLSSEAETKDQNVQTLLNEIEEMKNKVNLTLEKSKTDNKDKFSQLRTVISHKTMDLNKRVITDQEKLNNNVNNFEKMQDERINQKLELKQKIESEIDMYSAMNTSMMDVEDLDKYKEKLQKLKSELNALLESLEELKLEYELKPNESMLLNHNSNILGEVVDKNQLLAPNHDQLVIGTDDGLVKLYSIETGAVLKTLNGHHSSVSCVRFLSHTKLLTGSGDNTIRLWCIRSGDCLKIMYGHNGTVFDLLILPNNLLASSSVDKTIKIWELKKTANFGKCIRTLIGHHSSVQCLALYENDKIISGSNDTTIRIWQITSGLCLATLTGHKDFVTGLKVDITNNQLISSSKDPFFKVWDLITNKSIKTIKAHFPTVDSIELLSDNRIATGGFDESIKIWNRQQFDLMKTLIGMKESFICLKAISNDTLLSCSTKKDPDVNPIKIWDLNTGECLKSFGGKSGAFCSIDFLSALINE